MNTPEQAPTHRARPRYTVAEKLEIVRFARFNSTRMACEHFHAARSSIYLWIAQESALLASYRALQHSGQHDSNHSAAENATAIAASSPIQVSSQACEQLPDEARAPRHIHVQDSEANQAPSRQDQAAGTLTGEYSERPSHTRGTLLQSEASYMSTCERGDVTGPVLVGYQGANHGFSYTAAQLAFSRSLSARTSAAPAIELTGYSQPSHVLDALHKQEIDIAFIATDVLLSNTYHAALNQMIASRLKIISEVVVQEDVEVCALPGTELCDADCVVSDWRTLQ
jgi:hypothetical protein